MSDTFLREPKTPGEIVDALREGEKDGRLPERLRELCVGPAGGLAREPDETVPELVYQLLRTAVEKGLPRIVVTPAGLAEAGIKVSDSFIPSVARRLWAMAGQPYWAPEPASFRVWTPVGEVEAAIRLQPPDIVVVDVSRKG